MRRLGENDPEYKELMRQLRAERKAIWDERRDIEADPRESTIARGFEPGARESWQGLLGKILFIEVAGDCTGPVLNQHAMGIGLMYRARCRRCPSCLKARQALWKLRAEEEILDAYQSYFWTGTFAKQSHDYAEVRTDMSLFLKRARERCAARGEAFRYLVVPERHKSGAWHFHGLFHAHGDLDPDVFHTAWGHGFTTCDPADAGAAWYIAKYMTKDLFSREGEERHRMRASRGYGAWVMEQDEQLVKELLAKRPPKETPDIWTENFKMIKKELRRKQRGRSESNLLMRLSYGQS